jgi:hypothetical protein
MPICSALAKRLSRNALVRPGVMDTGIQAHARAQPPDVSPGVELFKGLHREGRLAPPAAVASKIVTRLVAHGGYTRGVPDQRADR